MSASATTIRSLEERAGDGLRRRLSGRSDRAHADRLAYEFAVICHRGWKQRFALAAEVASRLQQGSIPTSPGLGLAASSLVAYALSITDVDPIAHSLVFERLANMRGGPVLAIEAARAAASVSWTYIDDAALGTSVRVRTLSREGALLIAFSIGDDDKTILQIHGHAGLDALASEDAAPMNLDEGAKRVRWADVCASGTVPASPFEGFQPTSLDEVATALALDRPGPIEGGLARTYLARRGGREQIPTLHPLLEPVLAPTCGVLVYQEQLMDLASRAAGLCMTEADEMRRAMGKKRAGEMARWIARFEEGCRHARVLQGPEIRELFLMLEQHAGYGCAAAHVYPQAVLEIRKARAAYTRGHEYQAARARAYFCEERMTTCRCLPARPPLEYYDEGCLGCVVCGEPVWQA
jgi:hypothetical protein